MSVSLIQSLWLLTKFSNYQGVDPPFRGVWREALHGETVGATRIEGGQKVFVDIAHAGMDVSDTLTSILTNFVSLLIYQCAGDCIC